MDETKTRYLKMDNENWVKLCKGEIQAEQLEISLNKVGGNMRLLMHILRENKQLDIDNTTISIEGILLKLREEQREVVVALINYSKDKTLINLKEVIRETFDLIQVCILILWRSHRNALDFDESNLLQDINIEHNDKLAGRGWTIETGIEIDVKE